ncbi:hypothetical protein [Nonomuraea sp. NPDC049141]|uniref:hypothetical protein n=1 Tax=unclassified Nonomuraea TaxID=2593643 RepID=UPI0033C07917
MIPRFAVAAWGLIVSAALVAAPLALRDRLPEPLATHWRRGLMSDGEMSFTSYLLMSVGVWCVTWAAWSEVRYPSQVGGWGIRGLPGSATIMLRGGECLIIRYRSGGQLAVSVDDAERGAALINALIAERPPVGA